jgi:hypothetical protein
MSHAQFVDKGDKSGMHSICLPAVLHSGCTAFCDGRWMGSEWNYYNHELCICHSTDRKPRLLRKHLIVFECHEL